MPENAATTTAAFDARSYWEQRLAEEWTLTGVGLRRLGRRFNVWAYRLRREVFLDIVTEAVPDVAHARVLDVGTGTGFYLDRWREAGAASVTGLDLTESAVSRLRERYPTVEVHRADIGAPLTGEVAALAGTFDAISVMDVVFHIVEDAAFDQAIRNLFALLKPGGVLIWSDAFARFTELRVPHRVNRRLSAVEAVVRSAGFAIDGRRPMFVLMNEPTDTKRGWPLLVWKAGMSPATVAEPIGGFLGWALYPIESRLVRRRRESPTTEIMVCHRPT